MMKMMNENFNVYTITTSTATYNVVAPSAQVACLRYNASKVILRGPFAGGYLHGQPLVAGAS